jgi:hypothetical protein
MFLIDALSARFSLPNSGQQVPDAQEIKLPQEANRPSLYLSIQKREPQHQASFAPVCPRLLKIPCILQTEICCLESYGSLAAGFSEKEGLFPASLLGPSRPSQNPHYTPAISCLGTCSSVS